MKKRPIRWAAGLAALCMALCATTASNAYAVELSPAPEAATPPVTAVQDAAAQGNSLQTPLPEAPLPAEGAPVTHEAGRETRAPAGIARVAGDMYATLDEAIANAPDGAVIELLANAQTEGMNLEKNLTIQGIDTAEGKPEITFTKYGIALWGKALTFQNCAITMKDIGSTPYTGEWNWQSLCAAANSSLTLDNTVMVMDGENAQGGYNSQTQQYKTVHALYFCGNNQLTLKNNSTLEIRNYDEDALEWDGNGTYNVEITDSTYISNANRSGFTGTFYATIDNGSVQVLNSTGYGSNGTYYTIRNHSNVKFSGNGRWGISAWRIDMTDHSSLIAADNGYSGVWTRVLNVDPTCSLSITGNGRSAGGPSTNAGLYFQGNGTYASTIEQGAQVIIRENAGSGIYTGQSICNLTMLSGSITGNGKGGAQYGGGIYNIGALALGPDVAVYNNHAGTAGDDLYSNKTITFYPVGENWSLDGNIDNLDCGGVSHLIDGWYDDAEGARWQAHGKTEAENHVVPFESFAGDQPATVNSLVQLKTAHGADAQEKASYPALKKTVSAMGSDGQQTWADAGTATVGEEIAFRLESNVPDDLMNYIEAKEPQPPQVVQPQPLTQYVLVFHDQMDPAFEPASNIQVTVNGTVLSEKTDYQVAANVTHTDSTGASVTCNFEVALDLVNLYDRDIITLEDIENAAPIVVTYTTSLSRGTAAGTYPNTAWVSYPEDESEKSTVPIDTYAIRLFKFDQANGSTPLAGAVFELYQKDAQGQVQPGSVRTLQTDSDGYAQVQGLDVGQYYLKETQAPDGYIGSDEELSVTLPAQAGQDNVAQVRFANSRVPQTGSTGALASVGGGAALLAVAGALWVVTRKGRQAPRR